jgi:hypothetical protein
MKILYTFLVFQYVRSAHLIMANITILMILDAEYKLRNPSLWALIHSPIYEMNMTLSLIFAS